METERKTVRKVWKKRIFIAVCAVLVIGGVWYYIYSMFIPRSDGHAAGSDFIVYAGPILPLNVIGDAEGIAADRSIHFSFEDVETSNHVVNVTDGYTLTNNTSGEKTIDIVYPFISGIAGSAKFTPTLSADGKDFRLELFIGDYTGGFTGEQGYMSNIDRAGSWKEYKSLLESGGYFKNALGEKPYLEDQPVTLYTFYDESFPEDALHATLAIEFYLPQGSTVMASGMNGGNSNEENSFYCYGYSVRQNTVQRVVVLGEPPSQVTVQGYANIGCKEKLDSVTGKVKVQAMLFSELIRDCMVEYLAKSGVEKISPLVTDEKAYRAVVSMFRYTALGEEPVHRYSGINLGLLIREAYSVERVMYLKNAAYDTRGAVGQA